MAQTPNQPSSSSKTGAPATETTSHVYISVDEPRRKKKRGSSRSSRRLTDIENRASKALRRVSKAVDKGVKTYRDKRDKSQRKTRDGALVDSYENAAVGIAEAVAQSSPVLTDFAKAVNTRRRRKEVRRLVRALPIPR
jgi:hypothetical protein